VIQPDHLGDGILALPALRALRRAAPFLRLTLMIGPWNLPLFCALGLADEVLTLPFPGFTRLRPRSPLEPYRMLWREAARLRRRAPLAAVILRDDHWWGAWLSALAGIPIRVGADHPDLRPFLTHPVQLGSTHVAARDVELVLALLRTLGADWIETEVTPQRFPLSWPVDPAAQKQVQALLDQQSLRSGFVVLHPGAGASAKCWPPDRWATVVDALTERGLAVVLTGKTGERPTLEEIARRAHSRVTILAGTLSLAMLAELLRLAQLVIGPDTGPLHLAVAVGTPSLHLFGPTRPERFGPWGPPERHRVLRAAMTCSRCGDIGPDRALGVGCMIALTPELVIREAERLLARGDQR
jgi:heptosyltransferase-2/heptosyltransferase-3